MSQLAVRRREIAEALGGVTELEFWNAGGSGSIAAPSPTRRCTEVAAGSGLLVPTLFDHYQSFNRARRRSSGCRSPGARRRDRHGARRRPDRLGPAGTDRLPSPWAPAGLHLTGLEGAGEVQTPVTGHPAALLAIGDLVWFRHAKSGEPFEHTPTVHLLSGDRFIDEVPTYRGHGLAF